MQTHTVAPDEEIQLSSGRNHQIEKKAGKTKEEIDEETPEINDQPRHRKNQIEKIPIQSLKGDVENSEFIKRDLKATLDLWALGLFGILFFFSILTIVWHWLFIVLIIFTYLIYICMCFRETNILVEAIMESAKSSQYFSLITSDETKAQVKIVGEAFHFFDPTSAEKEKIKGPPNQRIVTYQTTKTVDFLWSRDVSKKINKFHQSPFDVKRLILLRLSIREFNRELL